MLWSTIAALTSWRAAGPRWRSLSFAALAIIGLLIVVFGEPVESGG